MLREMLPSVEYEMAKCDRSALEDKPVPAVVTQPVTSMSVYQGPPLNVYFTDIHKTYLSNNETHFATVVFLPISRLQRTFCVHLHTLLII